MIGKFNIWEIKISMSKYNVEKHFCLLLKNMHNNKYV